jgi:hypothetical protein
LVRPVRVARHVPAPPTLRLDLSPDNRLGSRRNGSCFRHRSEDRCVSTVLVILAKPLVIQIVTGGRARLGDGTP